MMKFSPMMKIGFTQLGGESLEARDRDKGKARQKLSPG